MCFHYSITAEKASIEQALGVSCDENLEPVYHANGFNFPPMPVQSQENPDTLSLMHWGLIPAWIRSHEDAEKIRSQTLNARMETVFEKPSFRTSVMHQRCLVPADGFFEWMDVKGKKYPHYVYLRNREVFCFAGIYAHWTDRQTGEHIAGFSIITTEANPFMARIHNLKKRMPLILPRENWHAWLRPGISASDIRALMHPVPENLMQAHPISRRISSRTENSNVEEVLERVDYPELAFLS